jgi:hypothetical protein
MAYPIKPLKVPFQSSKNKKSVKNPDLQQELKENFAIQELKQARSKNVKQKEKQYKATLEYTEDDEPLMHEEQIQEYLENYEQIERDIHTPPKNKQRNCLDQIESKSDYMLDLNNLDITITKKLQSVRKRATPIIHRRAISKIAMRSGKQKKFTNIVIVPNVEDTTRDENN